MIRHIYVYEIEPIDYWAGWAKPETVLKDEPDFAVEDACAIDREDYVDLMLHGQELARSLGWEGDVSLGPYIGALAIPDLGSSAFMIGWKQSNNGVTYVVSPIPLPHLSGFRHTNRAVPPQAARPKA